ncbi:DUF305 domain-containing protein [Candidatus Uhrbacteria bacterium]|nr:DUF305 domain-containing protein [Candidatus Uhrbacteria bacterium]
MQKSSGLPVVTVIIIAIVVFFLGALASQFLWTPYAPMMSWGTGVGRGVMPTGYGMMGGMMGHSVEIRNDADFLMGMIPHHQEAVDTASYAITKTQDEEIKVFLQSIIDAQTAEIIQMKRWHVEWYGSEYTADQRYRPMMPNLRTLSDNQVIPAFLHGMIMHHMGAIDMAREILPITERSEMVSFAQGVIRVQSEEIGRMLEWLSERAGYMPMMIH